MILGGINRSSMIDYPGKISCVLFTSGCNFKCPYCHNPDLVTPGEGAFIYDEDEVFRFLEKRQGLLDGVVITGGEPTLHTDLPSFCRRVKALGYPVKLDTNGSRPVVLKNLIEEKLVDYIAMDIKTAPVDYAPLICDKNIEKELLSSISHIMESRIPYEFRTTCVTPLVNERVVTTICETIKGASLYALQNVSSTDVLNPEFFESEGAACDRSVLEGYRGIVGSYVENCIVR